MRLRNKVILGLFVVTILAIAVNPVFAQTNGIGRGTTETGTGAFEVSDLTMCKDIYPSATVPDYPSDPIDRTTTFQSIDPWAICWVRFGGIADDDWTRLIWDNECPIVVTWEWYTPSATLYMTDSYTIPKPSDYGWIAWVWFKVWSILDLAGVPLGSWTVVVTAVSALDQRWTYTFNFEHVPPQVPEFPFTMPVIMMVATIAYLFVSKKYRRI